ncbi:MAG: GNAT family N-acetyltransferase [Proteobacteria bacterium]|nr:GNAT family N-acetyltransferase [Pseudomonadota bacterium]
MTNDGPDQEPGLGPGGARIEVVTIASLGPSEWEAWDAFVGSSPNLSSPFFQSGYCRIAGEIAPRAKMAVIHRGGRIEAFVPFQSRGREIQPLAAPLTDYHGPVAAPGTRVDLAAVVQAAKAGSFRFTGPCSAGAQPLHGFTCRTMVADLSRGFPAYEQERLAAHKKYFRDKERAARSLVRDHGEVQYNLDDPEAFDWLLAHKRSQYRATGQHDIFACGWTVELLQRLLLEKSSPTRGRVATMRIAGELVAAEYSLLADARLHFWFPAYDATFRQYSPGVLLTLQTLRLASLEGLASADFGTDGEAYKKYFAEPTHSVLEGVLPTGMSAATIISRLPSGLGAGLSRLERKAGRRWGLITACEPHWPGVAGGAASALGDIARRRLTSGSA